MGDARCGHIVHFRAKTNESKKHPRIDGYTNINATSGNTGKWGKLSPMKIGPFVADEPLFPCAYYPDGVFPGFTSLGTGMQRTTATNFESWWQALKIYDVDVVDGVVQRSFFERRQKMHADPKPHRRSIPKSKGSPVGCYFAGKLYTYLESRIIYCTYYEILVKRTDAWKELVALFARGEKLHILEYDGQDIPITREELKRAYLNETYPFGHGLVLCSMLKEVKIWEDFPLPREKSPALAFVLP